MAVLINLKQELAAAETELAGLLHSAKMLEQEISEQHAVGGSYYALLQRQAAAARRQGVGCETVVLNLKHAIKAVR